VGTHHQHILEAALAFPQGGQACLTGRIDPMDPRSRLGLRQFLLLPAEAGFDLLGPADGQASLTALHYGRAAISSERSTQTSFNVGLGDEL